jgi:Zn-dependent peptidase ImmA (M78 family)
MTQSQQAKRIVQALPVELREALRYAPSVAMVGTGLVVRAVRTLTSSRGAGGMCDGMSFSDHNTVLYAPTESRRENFTLLHEYAHLLVDDDDEALVWLADQDEPGVVLERLCDDIAAALLTPDDILDQIVGQGPITGQHLIDLFQEKQASQVVAGLRWWKHPLRGAR